MSLSHELAQFIIDCSTAEFLLWFILSIIVYLLSVCLRFLVCFVQDRLRPGLHPVYTGLVTTEQVLYLLERCCLC